MMIAPQSDSRSPKAFQAKIIDNLCAKLLSAQHPPCLLRSPTGSGKTFMLTRALQRVSSAQPTLWLWFVPFVNLVAQTIDSIDSEGQGLTAQPLTHALNEAPAPSLVLISTVQAVASSKDRKTGYTSTEDDERRSLASYIARARSQGLSIGCVVDEAHIALKSSTEFGQFVQWLRSDYLLMATATPRDEKLSEFITASGYSHYETFSVSRADVVRERLNKAYIETVVYDLRESMQSITDLKLTVLRRAWRRHQQIAQNLQAMGLATVPLLLVQVSNGDKTVEEAVDFLCKELKIPPHAIGQHSADEPDPVMMAAIANDSSKQVLVFKQSAGTGFDAPRAFVLASTKPVNDPDFATQFIGRVMRVAPELQKVFPDSALAPAQLDTAYVFLANAAAQEGFEQAAKSIQSVKSELEGQTEALHLRRTAYGGVALTNRPTDQTPLTYDLSLLPTLAANGQTLAPRASAALPQVSESLPILPLGTTGALFGDELTEAADELVTETSAGSKTNPISAAQPRKAPTHSEEIIATFAQAGIRTIRRNAALSLPEKFVMEYKPAFNAMSLNVQAAIEALPLELSLQTTAVQAALNRMSEREIYTELFSGQTHEESVQVITDADALLEITLDKLESIGLEEQDAQEAITAMAQRLLPSVEQAWALQDETVKLPTANLRSKARQAACWVIHKRFSALEEQLHTQWASSAKEAPAQLLPDALLLPEGIALQASPKSSYGVLFPRFGQILPMREALPKRALDIYRSETYVLATEVFGVAAMDATFELNDQELRFAKALDRADFVHWWHRNPQGKAYSVGLVRADNEKNFYPDFVVCLEHVTGEPPLMRLVDPKHDTKDASRKSKHVSRFYGKVLFLTKDQDMFKIVNDDGSVGASVDFDDLAEVKHWMRATAPSRQSL